MTKKRKTKKELEQENEKLKEKIEKNQRVVEAAKGEVEVLRGTLQNFVAPENREAYHTLADNINSILDETK
jgi:hypothetical protein